MQFYDEPFTVFQSPILSICPLIINDNSNMHVERADDPDVIRLTELLTALTTIQHLGKLREIFTYMATN